MLRNTEQTVPRLAPLEPPYDDHTQQSLERLGPPIALFRLIARRTERADAVHGWGSYYLSHRSALTLRHRELAINRTTARCGAKYEFGIHIAYFAAKADLTNGQIESLAAGNADDPCWTDPADRAVLNALDALHDHQDLTDRQWNDLLSAIGEEATIDLLLVAGWYRAISYLARVTRLPLEPGTLTPAELIDGGATP